MTQIALVQFDSGRHDQAAFARDRSAFLGPLRREFEIVSARPGEEVASALQVVFIASGGSEREFRRCYPALQKPVILLADGLHNSLPAALEISSWVRRQGERAEIVHGGPAPVAARLRELVRFRETRIALRGPIGIIGEPSDWLIASTVDRIAARARWGTEFIDIGLEEITHHPAQEKDAAAVARQFIEMAEKLDGVEKEAIRRAALLAPALEAAFARHHLRAATVRCFSLIETLGTSGCLALAWLNDQGMVCGCEGDIPAVFSMLLAFALTGEFPFLANPASVDAGKNQVVMAHCSVPRRAVKGYRLQTHFETGLGVALGGKFPPGPATVFKVGGPGLGNYFVSAAEALPAEPGLGLCRTQVLLELQEAASYFLRASLANHHIVIAGNHAGVFVDFMSGFGAQRVR